MALSQIRREIDEIIEENEGGDEVTVDVEQLREWREATLQVDRWFLTTLEGAPTEIAFIAIDGSGDRRRVTVVRGQHVQIGTLIANAEPY